MHARVYFMDVVWQLSDHEMVHSLHHLLQDSGQTGPTKMADHPICSQWGEPPALLLLSDKTSSAPALAHCLLWPML